MMIRFSLFLLVIPMICIGCNVRNIDVDDNVSFSNPYYLQKMITLE